MEWRTEYVLESGMPGCAHKKHVRFIIKVLQILFISLKVIFQIEKHEDDYFEWYFCLETTKLLKFNQVQSQFYGSLLVFLTYSYTEEDFSIFPPWERDGGLLGTDVCVGCVKAFGRLIASCAKSLPGCLWDSFSKMSCNLFPSLAQLPCW